MTRRDEGAAALAADCPGVDIHHVSWRKSHLNSNLYLSKAVAMISMSLFNSMLIPILSGMILLAIGFNFRDKNAGVFSMWIGMLVILATVVIKILAKLNE